MNFNLIFTRLRKDSGMTQLEVAEELGVSKSTVAMWETGDRLPSPALYEQIADYFNVDMDYLFGKSPVRKKVHFDFDGVRYEPLNDGEAMLINAFNKLNKDGKKKVFDYVIDLLDNKKYIREGALEVSAS